MAACSFQAFVYNAAPVDCGRPMTPIEESSQWEIQESTVAAPTRSDSPIVAQAMAALREGASSSCSISRRDSTSSTNSTPNFSRVGSLQNRRTMMRELTTSFHAQQKLRPCGLKQLPMQRWDGVTRTAQHWDSLRRDDELYFLDGQCAVYFHARGKSQRGPSLRVPLEAAIKSGCIAGLSRPDSSTLGSPASDSGYSSDGTSDCSLDLYVPAPSHLSGSEAYSWHVTTRNIFAWMVDLPLVGYSPGLALVDLLERMLSLRPATEDTVHDCVAFAERMGYTNMVNHPDHALSMLHFAEHFRIIDLWNKAFVHCVGLRDVLYSSPDYEQISKKTQALLTRAHLHMDLKVSKVTGMLHDFMEEEVSPAKLGLTLSQRNQLDRFRTFLQTFYVAKYGQWPPSNISKDIVTKISREFQCLHDLLADKDYSLDAPGSTTGGLCVLQNVSAFNLRNEYQPMTHSTPRSPRFGDMDGKALRTKGFRAFLGHSGPRPHLLQRAREGLLLATNKSQIKVVECPLVQAYLTFEYDSVSHLEPDVTVADARKVRWLQIYFILQTLRSITGNAEQSGGSEGASYYLCCEIPAMPESQVNRESVLSVHPALRSPFPSPPPSVSDTNFEHNEKRAVSPIAIRPDCEDDDYLAPKSLHKRHESGPSSIKPSTPIVSRTNSLTRLRRTLSLSSRSSYTAAKRSSVIYEVSPLATPAEECTSSLNLDLRELAAPRTSVFNFGPSVAAGLRTPTLDLPALTNERRVQTSPSFGPFELSADDKELHNKTPPASSTSDTDAASFCTASDYFDLTKGDLCKPYATVSPGLHDSDDSRSVSSRYSVTDGSVRSQDSADTGRTSLPAEEVAALSAAAAGKWAEEYGRCLGLDQDLSEEGSVWVVYFHEEQVGAGR